MIIQLPKIAAVSLSPNPVLAGKSFLISVKVDLVDVTLYPEVNYLGERFLGERW